MAHSGQKQNFRTRFCELSIHDGEWNEVLFETQHFVVLPTLGMLVEGWLLVVPKRQCLNFGYLNEAERRDYAGLEATLHSFLETVYCAPVVFEHGPSIVATAVGCGVDYAHRHFVPITFDLWEKASEMIPGNWVQALNSEALLSRCAGAKQAYLHICQHGTDWLNVGESFGSQSLRKVIAAQTNQHNLWDWKTNYFTERISATMMAFRRWNEAATVAI